MFLIDIGNTYAKIFDENKDITTIENKDIINWLGSKTKDEVYICSVVPDLTQKIKKLFPNIIFIDINYYDELIKITDDRLYQKGADRIILGYGARQKYGENLIVVDMGTCITVDTYVKNEYKSGYIYPGLEVLRTALNKRVKHLPTPIEINKTTPDLIETNSQLVWGNVCGAIGAINQFVNVEKQRYDKEFKIIISGGSINDFEKFLKLNNLNDAFSFNYIKDSKLIFESMEMIVLKHIK